MKPISLIGIMGSGKTTIGKKLASYYKVDFVDTDEIIENQYRTTISNIFKIIGEAEFREIEYKIISQLLNNKTPYIISTGGGAFSIPKTRKILNEKSTTVWLKTPLRLLKARLQKNRLKRPLIAQDDWEIKLESLFKSRTPLYAKAKLVVPTYNEPMKFTLERCIITLKNKT